MDKSKIQYTFGETNEPSLAFCKEDGKLFFDVDSLFLGIRLVTGKDIHRNDSIISDNDIRIMKKDGRRVAGITEQLALDTLKSLDIANTAGVQRLFHWIQDDIIPFAKRLYGIKE